MFALFSKNDKVLIIAFINDDHLFYTVPLINYTALLLFVGGVMAVPLHIDERLQIGFLYPIVDETEYAEELEVFEVFQAFEEPEEPEEPEEIPLLDDYYEQYTECVIALFKAIPALRGPQDCAMLQHALENLVVPSCEYLIESAHKLPEAYQEALCNISEHLVHSEMYVVHSSHSDEYVKIVEAGIRRSLSQLSLFSEKYVKDREEKLALEQARKKQEADQKLQALIQKTSEMSDEQIMEALFYTQILVVNRGGDSSKFGSISAAQQQIHEHNISVEQLFGLNPEQLNCLIFDGCSREALEIVEDLVASLMPVMCAPM